MGENQASIFFPLGGLAIVLTVFEAAYHKYLTFALFCYSYLSCWMEGIVMDDVAVQYQKA